MKYLVASTFEGRYQPLNTISATSALLDADINAQLIDIYVEGLSLERFSCSGPLTPDTHLGENARQIEVSDDQTTPFLFP